MRRDLYDLAHGLEVFEYLDAGRIVEMLAISEFPKGRKYLISLSFRGKASVRPAQVGGFDVNIVIHGSTAVRGRGDLVAYRWALWKLTAPWTHRTRPPHLGKRCAFSTSSTGPFPSNHSRKTPKGPKIALGNPDRPEMFGRYLTLSGQAISRAQAQERMFAKLANPRFLLDVRPLLPAARAETLTEESTAEAFRRVFMTLVDRLSGEPWGRTPAMKQRFGISW